ncbi:MAG: hypothetical protein K2P59_10165, partial [Acetatifactor sp.]|nr:hypothetical protein [Acetatifactor sp.]
MRKWLKKSLAVGLALVMTAGLSACGGTGGSGGSGGSDGGSGNRGGSSANAQLAKENVYKVEEFEFPKLVDPQNGYVNVYSTEYRDGKIYMVAEVSDWSKEENGTEYDLIIMNADGSDTQVVKLDTSDGEDDSAGESSEDAGNSAPAVSPRDLLDMAAAVDVADPGVAQNTWEYTSYGNFSISSDGRIFGVKNHNFEDYSDPEQYVSESHIYI